MKIPSSPRKLAGCYEVRQVLGQSGEDLVVRADERGVRWGNDVNGAIDGRPVLGPLIIPESHILNAAWCLAQNQQTWPKPSAPRPPCTKNKDRITMR